MRRSKKCPKYQTLEAFIGTSTTSVSSSTAGLLWFRRPNALFYFCVKSMTVQARMNTRTSTVQSMVWIFAITADVASRAFLKILSSERCGDPAAMAAAMALCSRAKRSCMHAPQT